MKKPWESKTVFVSALAALLGGIAAFWPNAGYAATWINSNGGTISMILGFVGIGLRMITKDKLQLFGE